MSVNGFKGTTLALTCHDFQFEEGKTYRQEGTIRCCDNGFHFCLNPLDVFCYYAPSESRYFMVKADGVMDPPQTDYVLSDAFDGSKRAAEIITIGKEISIEEYPIWIKNFLETLAVPPVVKDNAVAVSYYKVSLSKGPIAITANESSLADAYRIAICQSTGSYADSQCISIAMSDRSVAHASLRPREGYTHAIAIAMDESSCAVTNGRGIGIALWSSYLKLNAANSIGYAVAPDRVEVQSNSVLILELEGDMYQMKAPLKVGKDTVIVFKSRHRLDWRVLVTTQEMSEQIKTMGDVVELYNKQHPDAAYAVFRPPRRDETFEDE